MGLGGGGYKAFGTPAMAGPGSYFQGGMLPDAVDGKLMGAYWNTLEKEDKDCETFADLHIEAERAYSQSLLRPDEDALGPMLMRDLRFKMSCKPLHVREKRETKESKSKIAEFLEDMEELFYSQDPNNTK